MKFLDRIGLTGSHVGKQGHRYTVGPKEVVCPHCGSNLFMQGRAQLNTIGLTFFNLDWLNKSAATLACTNCGRIEWFLSNPEKID